jgi:hypothetical protein
MSFYTSSIKTSIHDARLFKDNRRAEFRLDDSNAVYLSNLRLANIGITATTQPYNLASGCYEVIDRLSLYDGNTLLDQQLLFPVYTAFKNYMKDNASNRSLNHFLNGSGMGYELDGADTSTSSSQITPTFTTSQYQPTAGATFNGWLDLKECLPFLQSVPYLPTAVFKNLRVVIEYNSAVGSNQNTTAPLLIGDEMMNEDVKSQLVRGFKQYQFVSVEHDSITIDAITGLSGATTNKLQQESKLLKGFDNKLLNRMVVVKTPVGATNANGLSTQLGQNASCLMFREKENLRVNGRTLLVGDGLDSSAKATAMLTDVYGTANMFLNRLNLPNDARGQDVLSTDPRATLGEQDYRAFRVGQRIEQMELQFERTGVYHSTATSQTERKQNAQLTLNCFGEVVKQIQVQPSGDYLIAYA